MKTLPIMEWNLFQDIQIKKTNLGIVKDPKNLKLIVDLEGIIDTAIEVLL